MAVSTNDRPVYPEPMKFETTVDEVIPRTHDTKSFRFKKPDGFDHLAGQWMYVTIRIDGNERRKHFTISSSPTEGYLEFTKKIRDSEFSQALGKLKGGEWASLEGPYGSFYYDGQYPEIGFLSGGIGITPIRSICRFCTDKKLNTGIILLYASKTPDDIVFREELESMEKANPNINVKHVISRDPDWQGLKGHIDSEMIRQQIPDYRDRVFYICGPPAMNDTLQKELKKLGLPEEKIKVEHFSGY